jgi:hypothetical protein
MSIQNIIDRAQQIEIDRRRIVAQTISRSQRIKTSERSTAQPWRFKVTPPGSLPWTASRGFIEVIDLNDRVGEYTISLNNNPGMNYITAYQGIITTAALNNLSIHAATTSTLTITDMPAIGAPTTDPERAVTTSTVMFYAGDLIQPANSRYPYTVVSTVIRGASTTTSVTLHRPIITSEGINLVGQSLKIGNSCSWRVIISGLPSYQLVPMRQVQYTGDFELIEKVI